LSVELDQALASLVKLQGKDTIDSLPKSRRIEGYADSGQLPTITEK